MQDANSSGTTVSLAEAAKALKTTELNVLMHIKRRLLEGAETAGGWQVSRASLEALLAGGTVSREQVVCPPSCGRHGGCSSCK